MRIITLAQFLLVVLISTAHGQKVKYKDIYALLSTKQYEQAEPFLKVYLKENTDNPNAYLFMAYIYQEKALTSDVLKETDKATGNIDSAVLFYDKAYKTIDDREIRKNKDYYQSYNRRDLRTGEFGIKLSDIQFDIEKRVQSLKDRRAALVKTKSFWSAADSAYRKSNERYAALQDKFASLNQLHLRANDQVMQELAALAADFESATKAFGQYRETVGALGKTGYDQKLALTDITDFKRDGRTSADMLSNDVRIWNYGKFAASVQNVVKEEVIPMRTHLLSYNAEIGKLRAKLDSDSVSVRSDLTKLIDKLLFDQLRKFDSRPLPMLVFSLKSTDLEYRSALLEHKALRDSSDIFLQMSLLNKELSLLTALDSTASLLDNNTLETGSLDYPEFVKGAFDGAEGLKRYVQDLRDFVSQRRDASLARLEFFKGGLNFIIDGTDSIPLADANGRFRPLVTTPEKFTFGLSLKDSTQLSGYFYTITASRLPEAKAYFPVDKSAFTKRTLNAARALAYSDAAGQVFYVLLFSENPVRQKYPATLAKIYRSDGLAWKVDYPLTFTPSEIAFSSDTGELVIRNGDQSLAVDKNGKLVR